MPHRLTPLEIMTKLISFPTVSRDTNLPLVDWVEEYLGSHGIEAHRWPDPAQPHKAAVFAHVRTGRPGPRTRGPGWSARASISGAGPRI